MCKAPVKSSPSANQHAALYRPDALPVAQPTASDADCINCSVMTDDDGTEPSGCLDYVEDDMNSLDLSREDVLSSISNKWRRQITSIPGSREELAVSMCFVVALMCEGKGKCNVDLYSA